MNNLKGITVFISGASSGIGRACAVKFAEKGANLILAARRVEKLDELKKELEENFGISVQNYTLDVRDRKAVEELGKILEKNSAGIDILVNNAGLSRGKDKLFDAGIDGWEEMIDTNIKGVLYLTRVILPNMVKKDSGHIITLGSIAGEEVYTGGNVYNMTKFAVKAFTKSLALDLAGTSVKVSTVSPGAVNTEFSLVRYHGDKEKAGNTYNGFTPLTADDVADAILYVANTPKHVNIQEMLIMPTAQRSATVIGINK